MYALARQFKALADETRLKMMALLLDREELCVCDLEKVLGITQSKASRHLRYLKEAGLLCDRREGLWVHYSVRRRVGDDRQALLEVLRRLLRGGAMAGLEKRLSVWLSRKATPVGRCAARPSKARAREVVRKVGSGRARGRCH